MNVIPKATRFGAQLSVTFPNQLFFHPAAKPVQPANPVAPKPPTIFQEIADVVEHTDEFERLLAAIDDQVDPQQIHVDATHDKKSLHCATINTTCNGRTPLLRNEQESLVDFIRRTLAIAKEKAKSLLTPEAHQEQQKQLITQAFHGFAAVLAAGALQKLEENVLPKSSPRETVIRVRAGEREYLLAKEDVHYTGGKTFPKYRLHWLDNGVNYYLNLNESPVRDASGASTTAFSWGLGALGNPFPLPHLNLQDRAKEVLEAIKASTLFSTGDKA